MKPTDFAVHLSSFLTEYLPVQKNASIQTISSYRDTFKLLLIYLRDEAGISPEKLTMKHLNSDTVIAFLKWLEVSRSCRISTRNQRLTAIRSFFRYAQFEEPSGLFEYQKIISLPSKKTPKAAVQHMNNDEMKALLAQPDKSTARGRRDLALLCFLYDSGCRVQELIDFKVRDLIFDPLPIAVLTGKGRKNRRVPIERNTAVIVKNYLSEQHLNVQDKRDFTMFFGNRGLKLTREGVTYIIEKYIPSAKAEIPSIPDRITPHIFRHSRAMALLQAGVSLIYIRDFLGHSDLKTTEIYAKTDVELKRKAIEGTFSQVIADEIKSDWNDNASLIDWLSSL